MIISVVPIDALRGYWLLYLARMSVSIFTSEDGPLKFRVVFLRVWGMI